MNRRTFLASAAIAPLGFPNIPIREAREKLTIAHHHPVHMIVTAHWTEQAAESHRLEWVGQPFESLGEWYLDSSERRNLPDRPEELTTSYSVHSTTIGAAAEHKTYLVGAFRKETISCIVRIIGDQEALMIRLAHHIASRPVPTSFEVLWNPGHVQSYIPTTADLGFTIENSSDFWP